jgi:hypothetical protein
MYDDDRHHFVPRRDQRRSRRRFLKAVGAGAVTALAATGGTSSLRSAYAGEDEEVVAGHFTRMFRLPPFAGPSSRVTAALLEIGKPGGILDAKDPLERGPIDLIVDPALSVNNPDNLKHTAGTTFVGQFMDHDMTFDLDSRLGQATQPRRATNARVPAFDLDSVYGRGPVGDPQFYDPQDRIKLKVESGGLFEDLPRRHDGGAIIGDPRNDENLIVAGLHAAFLLFHNHAVDWVRARQPSLAPEAAFEEGRRLTTWHYQWMIVHEFLPSFVGQELVAEVLRRGTRFYRAEEGEALIPVEFQGAAYRFGHSMVRPSYRANLAGDFGRPFFGFVFDPTQAGQSDPGDLRGGARAPRRFIGWQTFFDFGDGQVKHNKKIDAKISTPLFNLPLGAIPGLGGPTSLPQRNLLRHLTWQLPSGQDIARAIGAPRLSSADLHELRAFGLHLESSTPLWYYVLKEAEIMAGGLQLGPVGGRIVAEVIIGVLQTDRASYMRAERHWTPTLPTATGSGHDFRMTDFLAFAEVDPGHRGQ